MLPHLATLVMIFIMTNYIFIDESGSPGRAQSNNDYFLISIVIFNNLESVFTSRAAIQQYRQDTSLPSQFEFHFHQNPDKIKRPFLSFLSNIDFKYTTFNYCKTYRLTYSQIAKEIAEYLLSLNKNLDITLDSNPHLFSELRKSLRNNQVKVKIREARSDSEDLLQVADYIAGITRKQLSSAHKDKYDKYLKMKKLPKRRVPASTCFG